MKRDDVKSELDPLYTRDHLELQLFIFKCILSFPLHFSDDLSFRL